MSEKNENRMFTLTDGQYKAEILAYGATLKSLYVPDKNGRAENIVCGFDTVGDYKRSRGCFGATVGRVCNRIGNARFTLDGTVYDLPKNDGENHLHGGPDGFSRRVWDGTADKNSVELSLISPHMDMGYPGELSVRVKYTLKDKKLTVSYEAVCDRKTVVSLTNHSYFDICGAYGGRTTEAYLRINGAVICKTDKALIPTGETAQVENTPYDFTSPKPVGRDINADDEMLAYLGGYDTNYFLDGEGFRPAAELFDKVSGRKMTVYTDCECLQLYTANSVGEGEPPFSGGRPQRKHCGICLETQEMPNAVNLTDGKRIILEPGEEYRRKTVFDFNA